MKDKIQELVVELVRDYKSRKWLTILAYVALVVLNKQQGWGLEDLDLYLITGAVAIYVTYEGIADFKSR